MDKKGLCATLKPQFFFSNFVFLIFFWQPPILKQIEKKSGEVCATATPYYIYTSADGHNQPRLKVYNLVTWSGPFLQTFLEWVINPILKVESLAQRFPNFFCRRHSLKMFQYCLALRNVSFFTLVW